MKIVILTAIPYWNIGTQELIDNLREHKLDVFALDIFSGKFQDENNNIQNLIPKSNFPWIDKLLNKLLRPYLFKKFCKNADVIDIHFVDKSYKKILSYLGSRQKLVCSLFGSDLYRTNSQFKKEQSLIFERSNCIIMGENMVDYFNECFPENECKIQFTQYGSKRIDLISQEYSEQKKLELKKRYGIDPTKIVVTCGYNAIKEQQHLKIISHINSLSEEIQRKLHLFVPLTYGGDLGNIEEINKALERQKISYHCFVSHLSDIELMEIRIVSDVTINMQTTDALSSSVKEALVAQNLLIVGDWLPYNVYRELGVYYLTSSFDNLCSNIEHGLSLYANEKNRLIVNSKLISNYASWKVLTPQWVNIYNSLISYGSK